MNLTPTQKADELIEKFKNYEIQIGGQYDGYLHVNAEDAKQLAIIAVDEMIAEFKKSDSLFATNFLAGYWQEVKTILTERL